MERSFLEDNKLQGKFIQIYFKIIYFKTVILVNQYDFKWFKYLNAKC